MDGTYSLLGSNKNDKFKANLNLYLVFQGFSMSYIELASQE